MCVCLVRKRTRASEREELVSTSTPCLCRLPGQGGAWPRGCSSSRAGTRRTAAGCLHLGRKRAPRSCFPRKAGRLPSVVEMPAGQRMQVPQGSVPRQADARGGVRGRRSAAGRGSRQPFPQRPLLLATTTPARQPGARPPRGGWIDSASIPLRAITHAITEFEFHISPVPSSSRPHTGVGTCGTTSSTCRASCS